MPKYNNDSEFFKDWTTAKLKDAAKGLHQAIYEIECYGIRDIRMLDGILSELRERGVEPKTSLEF